MRQLADQIHQVLVPFDGSWSDDFEREGAVANTIMRSHIRPAMYYFVFMDCAKNV